MFVAGVITSEMRERLSRLGIVKTILLDEPGHYGDAWASFLNEVFHHTVRITDSVITSGG